MGSAPSSLRAQGDLRRVLRDWDVLDVHVVLKKYRHMTLRYCVTMEQLGFVLGRALPDPFVSLCFRVFAPAKVRASPAVPVVDMMEVFVCLILLCQATMAQRVAFLFDVVDTQSTGRLSPPSLFLLLQAVARSIIKLTQTNIGVADTIEKLAQAGMATDPKRQDSVDKATFCAWVLGHPGLLSYLEACTGEARPRLYVALEKSSSLLGYIEFDSVHELHSASVDRVRAMATAQLGHLDAAFEFLSHGRPVARAKEGDVKAWELVPFAVLGTPGRHWQRNELAYSAETKRTPVEPTSDPHPNQQRPLLAFQFQHHHYTLPSFTKKVRDVAPLYKHLRLRLHAPDAYVWRLCQYWCGDWLVNQRTLQAKSRRQLVSRLRKETKPLVIHGGATGLVVKDTQGLILSHNPKLPSLQSKLRLLAMETQLEETEASPAPHHPPTMLIERHAHPSRYYSRLLGTVRTTATTGEWHVVNGHAAHGDWCKKSSSIPLQSDQIQVFPLLWLRLETPPPVPRVLDLPISTTECPVELLRILLPTLPDKRVLNQPDCMGRTLLHYAALFGHAKLLDLLLSERVLVDVLDSQRNTALHLAASYGRLKAVSRLLAHGASPTALNVHHQLPLHLALLHVATQYDISNGIFARYENGEQVVDLLWDRTPPAWWHAQDIYGHSVYAMEERVFGSVFEAARAGLVPRIQHLLESKKIPHLNVQLEILQSTALLEATERGRYNVVDYLVRQGADVFIANQRGATALHKAAARGFDRIAECLLFKYPRLINVADVNGKTALHVAIEHEKTSIALLICQYMLGHEHRTRDIFGNTPLHLACVLGNVAVARALLVQHAVETQAHPPLVPQKRRRPHRLGQFLKRPINNDKTPTPIETLLHGWKVATFDVDPAILEATHHRYHGLLTVLLEHMSKSEATPLLLAHLALHKLAHAPSMAVRVLELLAEHKRLALETTDEAGNTLLMAEVQRCCQASSTSLAVVRTLLAYGANVHIANALHQRPIPCAAFHGHDALLDVLLESVPFDTLHASCATADSALHMACLRGHLSTVQLLLSRGATLHACVTDESPLCFAVRSGSIELVQYLLQHGADVNLWLPLLPTRQWFGMMWTSPAVGHGGPLALALHAAPASFQEHTYDETIDEAASDGLAASMYTTHHEQAMRYLSLLAKTRRQWQTLYDMALLLTDKLIQIEQTLKLHVTAEEITRACQVGFWSVATSLLTHRRIEFPRPTLGAMHLAAAAGQASLVGLLASNGVDVDGLVVRSRYVNAAPLYFAFVRGQHVTAAKLYLLGASTTTTSRTRHVHPMQSHLNGWMQLASLRSPSLRSLAGAYTNMVHHLRLSLASGVPAVHIACQRGCLPLLQVYHRAGLSLQDVAASGHTPLTLALQHEQYDVVTWLVATVPSLTGLRAPHLPLATAARLPQTCDGKTSLLTLLLQPMPNETSCEPLPVLRTLLPSWSALRGATFDHLLQAFILASSRELWDVVSHCLLLQEASVEPYATWIRRAASCSLVLHRAAAANQVAIVQKLVHSFGVPPDLVVANMPSRTPIWYAGAHMALDAFVALVLALPPTQSVLPALQLQARARSLNAFLWPSHSVDATDALRVAGFETCTWRNLSAFSSYGTRALQHQRTIHRIVQCYVGHALAHPTNETNDTLLHLVVATRDEATVSALVAAGAPLETVNNAGESPWTLAAKQNDMQSTRIVQNIWPRLTPTQKEAVVKASTQSVTINVSTLAFLFQVAVPKEPIPVQFISFAGHAYYTAAIRTNNAAAIQLLLAVHDAPSVAMRLMRSVGQGPRGPSRGVAGASERNDKLEASESRYGRRALAAAAAVDARGPCRGLRSLRRSRSVVQHCTAPVASLSAAAVAPTGLDDCECRQLATALRRAARPGYGGPASSAARSVLVDLRISMSCVKTGAALVHDKRGQTPLHLIAHLGDLGLLQLWQRVGPTQLQSILDAPDRDGNTALHIAAKRGHVVIVEALQHAGSSAGTLRNARGWTPVLEAAKGNHLPVVVRLVLQQPPPETLVATDGISVVLIAADGGHFKVVAWLLTTLNLSSAHIQQLRSSDGRTLAHFAALFNALDLLSTTPACISLVNVADSHGCLPLHYALMLGHLDVVELLGQHGADVQSPIQNRLVEEPFVIATLLSWNPLPGWFRAALHANATAPVVEVALLRAAPATLAVWVTPRTSLLEAATRLGIDTTVATVLRLLRFIPLLCDGGLETRQRIFMQAVALNHVSIVDALCNCDLVHPIDKTPFFRDFIDAAIQHSALRGLEDMTLCLLRHWERFGSSGSIAAALLSPAEFAFQFATVLQHACIFGRARLVEYLVLRGGESILGYRVDEGPALVYAFAFGQREVIALLQRYGAEISALDGYFAPSLKLWVEYDGARDDASSKAQAFS
ncbi:hypothetical protein SDRG_14909 [Saprolegnia diclina VS20]|uniref:Calmodulin n=1 Tax=Saprolegnia diclina (strain VS20) TaxID=1156394 RepID=T0R5D9_SAPDV|nr:hypothetical protein SDRG_14909 [Saprolegnia diclina VS20]EQC27288.1 hypothetical protein SDRG_14909 [Saprolegnia diclina VS20]|eukprot:XP_008619291.1 hypothetical protein SDRG_14909 [Saprolegnia diclina VS20]